MKKSELAFAAIQVPVDFVAITVAAALAYYVRLRTDVAGEDPLLFNFQEYSGIVLIIALIWLGIFALGGLYNIRRSQRVVDELYRSFLSVSAGTMAVIIFIFLRRELFFSSRFIILAVWFFAIILVTLGRFLVRRAQVAFYQRGIGIHRIVVVGKNRTSGIIVSDLSGAEKKGYRVLKVLPSPMSPDETTACLSQLRELHLKYKIDQIIQTDPLTPRDNVVCLIDYADEEKIVFKYAPDLFQTEATNIEVRPAAGIPLVELRRTPLDGWGRIAKRTVDIIGSTLLIILASPIMLATAIAIKLDSEGTVFFSYKRIGQNGEPFTYFKFRSMRKNAHKMRYDPEFQAKVENMRKGTPMLKFKNDPRITRVGHFIRQYSIDELPEFFNVFIGRMSLVGPRPHEPEEVATYQKHHKKVLTLKPGVTGLPQISGRSDLNFEEEVRLDTYYIENWSLKLDLYILFRTPLVLLKRRQAL